MRENSLVMFHQGWTDIILCIGLIFYNLDNYKNVVLVIREDSRDMIQFIFRNIQNIDLQFIQKKFLDLYLHDNELIKEYAKKKDYDINLYGGAVNPTNKPTTGRGGDKYYFYKHYNINEQLSINNFRIERDYKLEEIRYNNLVNKIGLNYNIIFEDNIRKLSINKSKIINKNLPTFNLCNSSKICFDLIKIIENAKEIHILSTFWSLIIYNLQKKYNLFNRNNIYFHESARPNYYNYLYENNNWIIL
jgi:hypothetical protein